MPEPAFTIEETPGSQGEITLHLRGRLTQAGCRRLREELERSVRIPSSTRLDLSQVEHLDGAAAAVLAETWERALLGGAAVHFQGATGSVGRVLDLYTERLARECLRPPPGREPILAQIGRETLRICSTLREMLSFMGRCTEALLHAVRSPRTVNWRDVGRMAERHGADGIPITLMIAVLMGLITAFQAAIQLKRFGADYLVADLVGLSITRELGPLMTAIVVAGRSGAAIAAEVGTMKVSEEIDALRTLGLCPYRFLVFPRVLSLMLVLPAMILVANVAGILGGVCVALTELDVTLRSYLSSTRDALDLWSVFGGALKGVVFGALIGMTACERGLATRGGAEGVGRSTTSAVVGTLFYLVVADALFSVLFNIFGI